VKTFVDQRYLDEKQRFELRCACEACQHFAPTVDACSLGFPTEPHREGAHAAPAIGSCVLFCKYFEVD